MKITAPLLALALALASAPAVAQPDNKAAAQAHFNSAEAHFRSGNFRAAIGGYTESYKLFPAPILLFNIGLCHERLDEKEQAIARYRAYLEAEPRGAKAGEATTRVETLEKLIAAEKAAASEKRRAQIAEKKAAIITLRSEGKHAELAEAIAALYQLEPDDELIYELAVAREAAGQRDEAIAEYDRYLATETPARAGEARKRRDALATSRGASGQNNGGQSPTGPNGPTGPVDRGDSPSMALPIGVSAVAVAALVTGAVFGLSADGANGDLEDELFEVDPPVDSNDPRFDDGARDATIANVMFGAGLVTAAVAGYLWYRYLGARSDAAPAVSVAPDGGVDLGVKVRF